jgi:formate hydrogenlyase transcriptional activator
LAGHYVKQFSRNLGKTIETIPSEAMTALIRYPWPGNIRELQNVLERAVILTAGTVLAISSEDLRMPLQTRPGRDMHAVLEDTERQQILAALEETSWIVAGPHGAAARLGVKRSTLLSRMQKLGIHITRTAV